MVDVSIIQRIWHRAQTGQVKKRIQTDDPAFGLSVSKVNLIHANETDAVGQACACLANLRSAASRIFTKRTADREGGAASPRAGFLVGVTSENAPLSRQGCKTSDNGKMLRAVTPEGYVITIMWTHLVWTGTTEELKVDAEVRNPAMTSSRFGAKSFVEAVRDARRRRPAYHLAGASNHGRE